MQPVNSAKTSQLAALITAPEEADTTEIELETLRRIQLFRGLILRVKHAFIWNMAPLTCARLQRTGLLLKAFADFGANHPLSAFDGTQLERTQRFLNFLCQSSLPADARVSGVARHESHLLLPQPEMRGSANVWTVPTLSSRFRLGAGVRIEAYDGRPDHPAGATPTSIISANVVVFYRLGHYRVMQDVAEIKAILSVLADYCFGSFVSDSEKSPASRDLQLLEDLCADGYLVVEQRWTV